MIKKLFLPLLFIVLVGCSEESSNKENNENSLSINTQQNGSSEHQNLMKLGDFREVNVLPLEDENGYEFKDLKLDNAQAIIFQPIHLKEGEKVTLTLQLQSNDSFNNVNIGIIKDYSFDSTANYEIESIYSKTTDKELTVTYIAQEDSTYALCILGTMADTVGLTGKIVK
ncbi:hypothetical protein [Cytobacillus dafuensis]|uniref:Lipoprotein n=1 Tax=Cytobacillus dafuensis TaxID=1742359 RepID=A0A5B8Z1U8_CYTDA|nr:hypothetical protein [Cytobacillus dafuensis]QED46994.1 hypothetical protein FSZ17_06885 [Cytobacillus dafuensis]